MNKKILMFFVIVGSVFALASCKQTLQTYTYSYYDYMDTFITISISAYDETEAQTYADGASEIFSMYNDLTDNYRTLDTTSSYLENVYTLNQKVGQTVEIDKPLYDILKFSEDIKTLTDGYFDITIGKAIDIWKALIEADYTDNTIPEADYLTAIQNIEALDFTNNTITLTESDGLYYVTTQGTDLKLDLGAISKGYATQKVADYLTEQGVEYFYINSGSSSLYLAKNSNPDRDYYNVSLTCPVCDSSATYGTVSNVENQSVTTSGDYEQYVLYNDRRYHHIISPITLLPMNYYHTVTLVGDDAGLLDALSTALFSMPETDFDTWMTAHQSEYNLSYVRYNIDGTISESLLGNLTFEGN